MTDQGSNRVLGDDGNYYIPASQRPDGSWRKERKVKTGYVPQEEVPVYESKGRQFARDKPTYPVGMSPDQIAKDVASLQIQKDKKQPRGVIQRPPSVSTSPSSSSSSSSGAPEIKKKGRGHITMSSSELKPAASAQMQKELEKDLKEATDNPELEQALKKLRTARKKLQDIQILDQRIKSGELQNPEKNQLEKIEKRPQFETEVAQLEAEVNRLQSTNKSTKS